MFKSNVASIQRRSQGIKNVFTQTKEDCLALNQEIKAMKEEKTAKVAALQQEINDLDAMHQGHENLAAKIDSFLNS